MQPRILILRAPGTNCDAETAFAFQRAGGKPEIFHVRRVFESPRLLNDFQVLCVPGGFSYGDDIASGRIFGVQLQHHLADALQQFKAAGKLILGICNGFQAIGQMRSALAADSDRGAGVTLAWNVSRKFEDRWVNLATIGSQCVFLAGISNMYLPVAHGEGRFFVRDDRVLANLQQRRPVAITLCLVLPLQRKRRNSRQAAPQGAAVEASDQISISPSSTQTTRTARSPMWLECAMRPGAFSA